eukprot:CAMPEP_0168582686 /NCGR_PEP_ID=MMETSP0420-20121227/2122_1 /TAXON_ID=498008 /ORGANISM="Pessonella sp." /LENGTH=341 /DNA_ID=CAMNT_0008617205 /DNA_START=127 /DNA_END=1149 /DNA_ORIENTATION=+
MPRIWLDYCKFLANQKLVTRTRETYDRALRALPVTQHERIWKEYLAFVRGVGVPAMAVRVYRRYLKLNTRAIHDYVAFLLAADEHDEAARQLVVAIDSGIELKSSDSTADTSERALWLKLVELVASNAARVSSVRLEPVVRSALQRFTNDAARLWIALADYAIRLGNFEKARDVFEEALVSVMTVRDFSQIWDAYTRFEDELIAAQMESGNDADEGTFELRLARYEALIERQPFLLNSVLLRQNISNVHEWHKRVALYQERGDAAQVVATYTEALTSVDAAAADGKLHSLWVAFAKWYEAQAQLDTARDILQRATAAPNHAVDELVTVHCEAAELELRHGE